MNQIDQAVLINDEKIYIDNPNNDAFVPNNDTFVPESKTLINNKTTVKPKIETIKDNVESVLGIGNTQYTVPTNINFEEQQDIIDNLDLD